MLELPEAITMAAQINSTVNEKRIVNVIAAHTPHKFAWFYDDPTKYKELLAGKTIGKACGYGGFVEIQAGDAAILIGDGVGLRYHDIQAKRPVKHQLLIEFEDDSALSGTVQMYGGLWCFPQGDMENPYYQVAKEKPSPLSNKFNKSYFDRLISAEEVQKLSCKAFLATEQRIPGLGNGVLQEILYNAQTHPKKKVNEFSAEERERLFKSIKETIAEITELGGRDTEKNLFGHAGGFTTRASKNTAGKPCPRCGNAIIKGTYLGGSIYFCRECQPI
jgi:Formamidopyrimidine-DNA glycosylase